jgi:hypothetical protein
MKITDTGSVSYHDGSKHHYARMMHIGADYWKQIRIRTDWCLDNFGVDHFQNWYCVDNMFHFCDEEQLTLFVLRWS